jgi:hypothetical protein
MDRISAQVMNRLQGWLIALGIFSALLIAHVALAQPTWVEQSTTYFRIVYAPDDVAIANEYAAIIDSLYDEFSTTFAFRPVTPLTLRLYPTSASYFAANPAARAVRGVIAHADFRRREVAVIVERARLQDQTAQVNNLRHELTHIFAADLSAGKLNVGLQEGIAQYMELPGPDRDSKMAVLRTLAERGGLWSWATLDDRNAIYGQPDVSYPQTWSIVVFLIERDGIDRFRQFLVTLAQSSGYRSAMVTVYGVSATTLEAEWRTWLPSFLQLDAHQMTPTAIDLQPVQNFLSAGDYEAALRELERLEPIADEATRTAITTLQTQAQTGLRANQLTSAARTALLNGEYEQAERLIGQAEQAYRDINDRRQAAVLAEYRARVARGLQASERLRKAYEQARTFDLIGAQANAETAAREFAALGDDLRRDNALALRQQLARQQQNIAIALLFFGAAGIAIRFINRQLMPIARPW